MADLAPIGAAALTGVVTQLFVALIFSRRKNRARRDRTFAAPILEYGLVLKVFPFVVAAFFAFITISAVVSGIVRTDVDVRWMIAFVAFWSVLTAAFAAEVFGVAFELNVNGIRKRSAWSRGFYASWGEVTSVRFDSRWEWYVVDTPKGRMRLSILLNGLDDFRALVRERVPPAVVAAPPLKRSKYPP